MGSLGASEILVLVVLGILLLGPDQMVSLGRQWRAIKGKLAGLRMDFEQELEKGTTHQRPSPALQQTQAGLRKISLQWLRGIPSDIRDSHSQQIRLLLSQWDQLQNATTIAAFVPLKSEPDIEPLFADWLGSGKTLLLPRIVEGAGPGMMEFVAVKHPEVQLVAGPLGIRQPAAELQDTASEPDIILVPGVVFGVCGERIGRGAGFYDRLFSKWDKALRVGICFSGQIRDGLLPQSVTDGSMSYICAESGIHPKKEIRQ